MTARGIWCTHAQELNVRCRAHHWKEANAMDAEIIARMNKFFPRQSWLKALFRVALIATTILAAPCAAGQPASSAPPAVGVGTVERRPMTDSDRFNGRVQAINSVNTIAGPALSHLDDTDDEIIK